MGVLQELQNHAQQGGDDWQAFAMHYEGERKCSEHLQKLCIA